MATTKNKGDILEQVVAWLHEERGVAVSRNVRLPMLGSTQSRREIDVLLTAYVAGHEVRLAIECKNEAGLIGSPKIDKFRGKLEAVGIPPSLGIYVSIHGYTEGAIEAARAAGIKALVLKGMSADRLSLEVSRAFQSLIVLVPEVEGVNLVSDLTEPIADIGETFLFYDEGGEPAGTVADFVWEAWLKGDLAPEIGTTNLRLELPGGWHNVIANERQDIQAIAVQVKIVAMTLTIEGEATEASLLEADNRDLTHRGLTATFAAPTGKYRILAFESETALSEHLTARGLLHVVRRIKSPRIQFWAMMFWPPSQRVADIIAERMGAFERGEIPDPRPFSFDQLEGTDLGAAWEPIAEEYMNAWRKRETAQNGHPS
jgi:hypothetical protein